MEVQRGEKMSNGGKGGSMNRDAEREPACYRQKMKVKGLFIYFKKSTIMFKWQQKCFPMFNRVKAALELIKTFKWPSERFEDVLSAK